MKLRIRIAQVWNASSALSGEVEADKSYFCARRVRGKRGAEQAVKRSSSESWNATEKCRKSSLTPPRRSYKRDLGSGSPGSIIHADGWRGYNGLVDMGYKLKENPFLKLSRPCHFNRGTIRFRRWLRNDRRSLFLRSSSSSARWAASISHHRSSRSRAALTSAQAQQRWSRIPKGQPTGLPVIGPTDRFSPGALSIPLCVPRRVDRRSCYLACSVPWGRACTNPCCRSSCPSVYPCPY